MGHWSIPHRALRGIVLIVTNSVPGLINDVYGTEEKTNVKAVCRVKHTTQLKAKKTKQAPEKKGKTTRKRSASKKKKKIPSSESDNDDESGTIQPSVAAIQESPEARGTKWAAHGNSMMTR